MTFDRIDSLIIRRFPKQDTQWSAFLIQDGGCMETLNLLVSSGCVQRKAKVRWVAAGVPMLGYALLTGDWRSAVKGQEGVALGLDPGEFKTTLIRSTSLGKDLKPKLFNADSLITQFEAIEYIKNMSAVGQVSLFHDDALEKPA